MQRLRYWLIRLWAGKSTVILNAHLSKNPYGCITIGPNPAGVFVEGCQIINGQYS